MATSVARVDESVMPAAGGATSLATATQRFGMRLCIAGALIGALGLVGWITGIEWLTTLREGYRSMMPNAAASIVLLGGASALSSSNDVSRGRRLAVVCAASLVLAVGVLTLTEYILDVDLAIDRLLQDVVRLAFPGRPAPPTAVALSLLAASLLVYDTRPTERLRPSEWLAVAAAIIALAGLLDHLFGTGEASAARSFALGSSFSAAAALIAIAVGLLCGRPNTAFMRIATSRGPGGIMFRRLVLPVAFAPVVAAIVVRLAAGETKDSSIVIATIVAVTSVFGLLLLPLTGVLLERAYDALAFERERATQLVEHAAEAIFVADLDGRYMEVNAAACKLLDLTASEIIGKRITDFIPAEDVPRLAAARETQLQGGTTVAEWRLRSRSGSYVPVEIISNILSDGRWQAHVRDIRPRRALEEASRRAHARIEGIISIAADAIISCDEELRVTIYNHGAQDTFGWSAEEMLGQSIVMLFPMRLREEHRRRVAAFALSPRETIRMNDHDQLLIGLHKDGREFPAESAISKLRIGDAWTFTITVRDITQRVQLERALRNANELVEGVLESTTEHSVIALDLERKVVLWNEGARRAYGYTRADIATHSFEDVTAPVDVAAGAVDKVFAAALAHGSAEASLEQRRRDGSQFLAHVVVSCRREGNDGRAGFVVVTRDITREQRDRERRALLTEFGASLISSLERETMVEHAATLLVQDLADICIIDLEDVPGDEHTVRRWRVAHHDAGNHEIPRALDQLDGDPRRVGLSRRALQHGRAHIYTFVTPEDLDSFGYNAAQLEVLRQLRPSSMLCAPLSARRGIIGAITLLSCDSQRCYDEDDLPFVEQIGRQLAYALDNAWLYEVAARAVNAREELMSIVAHDLRNPIAAATLGVSMLIQQTDERRIQLRDGTERIRRSLARASRLIDDLLDLTRIEGGGGLSISPRVVSPRSLGIDATDMFTLAAESAGIELELEVDPELASVHADHLRIAQVIGNLVGNALKFTPRGGAITIAAIRVGDMVEFSVADTGEGVKPEQLAHLFDRYWQARMDDARGTGLGLAIARGIVEAHGGRIWAESEFGNGTTVRFSLPVAMSPSVSSSGGPSRDH